MDETDDKYLTVTEAAFYLGVSELTIRRRIKDGVLNAVQGGGVIRLRRSEIDRYMEGRK